MRKAKKRRHINDLVEDVFLQLCEDEVFQGYFYAAYTEQTITGSLYGDYFKAAEAIKLKAAELGEVYEEVAKAKEHLIVKVLRTILNTKYPDLSRQSRRESATKEPSENGF